jgi:hypothetical protein
MMPASSPVYAPDKSLPERYGLVIRSIDYPEFHQMDPKKEKAILDNFEVKRKALEKAVNDLFDKLIEQRDKRAKIGLPFTQQQMVEWWGSNGDSLDVPSKQYEDASRAFLGTLDPNGPITSSVRSYVDAANAAAKSQFAANLFSYEGSSASLQAMFNEGKAAEKEGKCDKGWTYNKKTVSEVTTQSSWGASASYGLFVSVGVNSSTFENIINADGTSVSLQFCSVSWLPISPGSWYSSMLLDLLKRGSLSLQKTAILKQSELFGEKGWLTRIPVGVVVAYKPRIEAKVTADYKRTFDQSWSGSGGIGIGPFRVGGSAGGSRHEKKDDHADGSFSISGYGDELFILAVISKIIP